MRLRWSYLLIPLLLALAALALWRWWQGPVLPGYVLESRPLLQRVVASGEVGSQSLSQLGSEITGVVRARHVREGDRVTAGQLLIELKDDEQQAKLREAEAALQQLDAASLPQARAALREAESNLAQARRERVRREQLLARDLLAREALEQARRVETSAAAAAERAQLALADLQDGGQQRQVLQQRIQQARAALQKTRILAPAAGVVVSRNVEPGDQVQAGRILLEITRDHSREIVLPLDEKNIGPLEPGQHATVIADAYPERPLAAQVSWLAPAVDRSQGTLDVHLELTEPADFLRQGMTVSVAILIAERASALVIPNDALHNRRGPNAEVLRLNADSTIESRKVRLGLRGTAMTEVLEGLSAGDRVVAGQASAGQRVRLALQALPGSGD